MILNKKYSERRLLSDWINLIHLEVSPVVVTFVRIKLNGHLLSNEIVETSNIFCEALLGAVHFVDQRPIDEYLAFHSILVIHEESCRKVSNDGWFHPAELTGKGCSVKMALLVELQIVIEGDCSLDLLITKLDQTPKHIRRVKH